MFFILKYFEYFMIYFFTTSILKDKKQVNTYIKVLLITFIIVIIYAITQISSGRVSAPFEGDGEPNTLGGYIILMQGIILGISAHAQSHRQRIKLNLLFIFSLIPFICTFSRASYLAFIPMYAILIFHNKSRRRNILIGSLLIAIIVSMYAFPQSVKDRLGTYIYAISNH